MLKLPFGLRLPQSQWGRLLLYAALIPVAWIGCFAVGLGAATLGARLFGCNINEGGDGGCPILGAATGLALLAAFGAPLFALALVGCLIGAAVAFVFRRRQ
jgi:hypothetical protein